MKLWLPLLMLSGCLPLFGGCGLYLDLGNPAAVTDPAVHGALATVRLFNCLGASSEGDGIPFPRSGYKMVVTAEGMVKGHRLSIPVKVRDLPSTGMRAVYWDLPKKGVWLLNFQITNAGPYFIGTVTDRLGTLVSVSPAGINRPHDY